MCESPSGDRIADFELKLMDIEVEHLGIPDTEYSVTVRMASSQYAHICRWAEWGGGVYQYLG
jgi:proliferating cell nuclear antigen